jgi:hypothetical protein
MGRIDHDTSIAAKELFWSGTSIKINFKGSIVNAIFDDEYGDNYYNILINDKAPYILKLTKGKNRYKLCELPDGEHSLTIFKRTEWDRGITTFYGIELNEGGELLPKSEPKKRKIEFYGNSITAGYGIEDTTDHDRPDSIFTNNYLTYAAITARHFDAQYSCICRSGIGIMISWIPEIMPEIYDRINPLDENSIWDFNIYQPDIVVVNLFQNDSWLVNMPEHESFKIRFGDQRPEASYIIGSYKNFIIELRNKYPKASIICALGSMDVTRDGSPWPGYVQRAVDLIDDPKIMTHFMPYKNTAGHPRVEENRFMAESLINFIDNNIDW